MGVRNQIYQGGKLSCLDKVPNSSMPLGNLVTSDDGWIYLNAVIIYMVFFQFPERIIASSIFLLVTIGISITINRLSSLEKFHRLIFKRQLIKSEIQRRRVAPNHDYDDLSAEGQDEVDKIDEYFHTYANTFSGLFILTISHLVLVSLQVLGVKSAPTFVFNNFNLNPLHLEIFVVIANTVLMYDSYHQIRRYMFVDLKDVYDKYS